MPIVSNFIGQEFTFLVFALGAVSAIFWMVVGWRAMRAHERLADAAEYTARKISSGQKPPSPGQ